MRQHTALTVFIWVHCFEPEQKNLISIIYRLANDYALKANHECQDGNICCILHISGSHHSHYCTLTNTQNVKFYKTWGFWKLQKIMNLKRFIYMCFFSVQNLVPNAFKIDSANYVFTQWTQCYTTHFAIFKDIRYRNRHCKV